MAPRSRGTVALFDAFIKPSQKQHICLSCRSNISRARYASTATAQATDPPPPIANTTPSEPPASPSTQPRITVKAGIVVSRPPLLTPAPHPFETAFHLYQRRLNERLVLPFSQYFHYKRGTPAFEHWRSKRRERGGVAARDLGGYNAYTKESWNDEVLMGDQSGEPRRIVEGLVEEEGRGGEFVGEAGGDKADGETARFAGLKRVTVADASKDQKSLERNLDRTLYLLVRDKAQGSSDENDGSWRFPSGDIEQKEGLKEAAQRVLASSCGPNMNTWFVASHPIGHVVEHSTTTAEIKPKNKTEAMIVDSEKTFFMKARIFSGQADVKDNSYGLEEFKWLAKEEIEGHVSEEYWASVRNMLVEQ